MVYVYLGLILLIVASSLCVILLVLMAHHLLHPPRMTDGKALYILRRLGPEDLGLIYEPLDFTVRDPADGKDMRIAGWWIPALAPSDRSVILLHGYSDAKIGGIAWAPVWQSLGWNVLAIDLRAHGRSGGRHSTGGYFEQDDVSQVIDLLRQAKPRAAEKIALFGVSLGATAAAGVGTKRDDLFAIILESPYADYRTAIAAHGRRLAMPLEWGYGFAFRLAERMSGARFDDVKPIDLIPNIRAPLLVIHAGADTFVSRDEIELIKNAIARRNGTYPSRHAIVEDVQHTMGLLKDPRAYREMLDSFLLSASATQQTDPAHRE